MNRIPESLPESGRMKLRKRRRRLAEFDSKRKWMWVLVVFVPTLILASSASAEIYVYKDRSGVRHFTNTPTSLKYAAYMPESGGYQAGVDKPSYDNVIAEASRRNDLSFHLLKAMIHVESCFDRYAISQKGALGLMQIMPENLSLLNIEDPFDPWDNVMGGAGYLKILLKRFDGNLELALAAYNAGPSVVERYNKIPPFPETREYVRKVLKFTRYYKNI